MWEASKQNPILIFRYTYGGFLKLGYPKTDGEKNGTPYEKTDDLGGKPHHFRIHTPYFPEVKERYLPIYPPGN